MNLTNRAIPYGRQYIDQDDINAVIETLKGDFLTQGPKIAEFERAFSDYVDAPLSIAVNNGTSALHLCAVALGVKPGDKVICPSITFAASANCIKYCGAEIIFCDIDPNTYLLDLNHVEKLFVENTNVKGVISVDFAGRPVDLEKLRKIADKNKAWIIQDSCHSPGGYFIDSKGLKQRCGNGNYADLAIFSFHPVKHIACGEGGMITTKNQELYSKIQLLRTHGITKKLSDFIDPSNFFKSDFLIPSWYYEMQELGYNYRLTDFQAALGISQLTKAKSGIDKREQIAQLYENVFKGKPWLLGSSGFIKGHAYHLYILEVERRDELYEYLRNNNVHCQIHYFPLHLMPYYYKEDRKELPRSSNYIKKCISLPIFPSLSIEDQTKVISMIEKFYAS